MTFTIPIHSFVNLITNSSTEIYVAATEQTAKTVKEIVNQVLKVGGSKLKCNDLLEISLKSVCTCVEDGYYDDDEEEDEKKDHSPEDCDRSVTTLIVKVKDGVETTPDLKKLLATLNDLTGMFEYGEKYN